MLKKISLPIQLVLVIGCAFLFGDYCPEWLVQSTYSISLLFRTLLVLILPLMVFSFIVSGCLAMKRNAPRLLGTLLVCIIASNALVAFIAYYCARYLLPLLTNGIVITSNLEHMPLQPLAIVNWFNNFLGTITDICAQIPLIKHVIPLRAEYAMLAAIAIGVVAPLVAGQVQGAKVLLGRIEHAVLRLKYIVERILMRFFIPLLPLYVLGFLLELNYRNAAWGLFEYYGRTFVCIIALQIIYLIFMYLVANRFSIKETVRTLRNALPSYLTALSTMSSTATIPVTIVAGEKNTHNRPLVDVAAPILANVHLVGDSVTVPILALVTVYLFMGTIISPLTFAIFIWYFCQAMLAVSGVPGGGIMVMIPILESILGFTPEMISLITALYVLQDAFGTATNVMGDGALMIIVNKIIGTTPLTKDTHGSAS